MLFKLLAMDIVGGGTPPVYTTPDTPSTPVSAFEWWILPLILIGIVAFIAILIFLGKKAGSKNSKENNLSNEQAEIEVKSDKDKTQLCCPKCNCNKIKFETETHKDKTFIKAICEDCGNLWLLN